MSFYFNQLCSIIKVEKVLKGSLDLISSPSPSVKIQIIGGKVCLRCKGKIWLGLVNKLLKTKSLLTTLSNVLPLNLKQTFSSIIWIFNESEDAEIKSRLPFKIFSTLQYFLKKKIRVLWSLRRSLIISVLFTMTWYCEIMMIYSLFVTSKNEFSNSPIHEFKVLHKRQRAL